MKNLASHLLARKLLPRSVGPEETVAPGETPDLER